MTYELEEGCLIDGAFGTVFELDARAIELAAALGGPSAPEYLSSMVRRADAGEEAPALLLAERAELALEHLSAVGAYRDMIVEWRGGDLIAYTDKDLFDPRSERES